MSYSLEVRKAAHDLYVESGLTYEQVAAETGVSINNLKKWGKVGTWSEEREEFERRFLTMTSAVDKAMLAQIEKAAHSQNAQDFYALGTLMTARAKISSAFRHNAAQVDKPALFLEFVGQLIEFLKSKAPEALGYLEPHIRGFAESLKAA